MSKGESLGSGTHKRIMFISPIKAKSSAVEFTKKILVQAGDNLSRGCQYTKPIHEFMGQTGCLLDVDKCRKFLDFLPAAAPQM
jgi:hypothetical protein